MSSFIFYRHRATTTVADLCAALLYREVALADINTGWAAITEYAAIGGYLKAARIEAGDPEEAWDRAHTDHMPSAKYVQRLSAECPGHSSVGDVFEDVARGAFWLCCDTGWREMPDDVAWAFRKALRGTPPQSDDLRALIADLTGEAA